MSADRRLIIVRFAAVTIAAFASATPAWADFAGQPILGPITAGSNVFGDLTGKADDNDGWFSGAHVFDLWDGGDDVWQLNWAGGDLTLTLTYSVGDPDLFLYTPGNLDESSYDNILGTSPNIINVLNAAPGTYYVLVDTFDGGEGAYQLSVSPVPAPGAMALLAGAGLFGGRRRRA